MYAGCLLVPSQKLLATYMQDVCWVSAGAIPGLVHEVFAINHLHSRVYAKYMQGVSHSLGFRWARGRPVLRLVSWHFRLNLLSCVFPIKLGVFETFAMRFTICLNNFA